MPYHHLRACCGHWMPPLYEVWTPITNISYHFRLPLKPCAAVGGMEIGGKTELPAACLETVPLSSSLYQWLRPKTSSPRTTLTPRQAERVAGAIRERRRWHT